MGSVMIDGKLYQNVKFVDSLEKAKIEVVYDRIWLDEQNSSWLYFYHGYLVATVGMN